MIKDSIISLLDSMKYKGKYIIRIKENFEWGFILKSTEKFENFLEKERLYLFLHPETNPYCENNRIKKFVSVEKGYKDICVGYLECDKCKKLVLNKTKSTWMEKYGVDNISKSTEIKEKKEKTSMENWGVSQPLSSTVVRDKGIETIKSIYGEDIVNIFQVKEIKEKSKNTTLHKYGVDNISKNDSIKNKKKQTCFENYGYENPNQVPEIIEKRKNTNLKKYGVDVPTKNKDVSKKIMENKIKNGSFDVSNSSMEATLYFRNYCLHRGYDLEQVAFSDKENGLFEFGYNFDGKWFLYDFVAFERGFRGNKNKIIEIVEYNGPFHYTEEDVRERGEEKAYPWKSKNVTIAESYAIDKEKELLAKKNLTNNYKIVWSEKYHKKGEIV